MLIQLENDEKIWQVYNIELKTIAEKNLKKSHLSAEEQRIFTKHLGTAFTNDGVLYNLKNDSKNAIKYYLAGLEKYEKCGEIEGLATSYNNIAYVYQHNGDITNAILYYTKSLKIWEELKNLDGISYLLNNLGFIYKEQGDLDAALINYNKCITIRGKLGNKSGVAVCLHNIGSIYIIKKEYNTAESYIRKGLKIRQELLEQRGIADSWHVLGAIKDYTSSDNNLDSALHYYERGLKIRKEINNRKGLAYSYSSIGNIYFRLKRYKQAEEYLNQSLHLSKELGFPDNVLIASKHLSKLYKLQGNHKLALENYELYITMRDSINNIETQKASIKQQADYDYQQKKAIADNKSKAKLQLQEETARAAKNKQNIIILAVSMVLLIVAIFSIFLYKRFKITQKQKAIIELKERETHIQKEIIEEKHKEITDSINYAERIQRSFLATTDLLDDNLCNYFVFFKPKDIVSGDFYWASSLLNGNFALVTADSTGHGVPGAIMSLLNITSIEKAIETTSSPAQILNLTRQTIINRLKKDGSASGGKDGMDCSLISFNKDKSKLDIAAANNPIWIIRNNELIDIKPDKMPVGKHDRDTDSFTEQEIDLQKGDVVYTLTDGFPDQFGGEKGKKFMSKKLKELLLINSRLPMEEQKQLLEQTFSEWVGDLEQVDDVTLIGVRV